MAKCSSLAPIGVVTRATPRLQASANTNTPSPHEKSLPPRPFAPALGTRVGGAPHEGGVGGFEWALSKPSQTIAPPGGSAPAPS